MPKGKVTKTIKVEMTKKGTPTAKVIRESEAIEITPIPPEALNEVILTIKLGKSTVTVKTTTDLYKQDCIAIWDKAMADLDELNAQ